MDGIGKVTLLSDLREIRVTKRRSLAHPFKITIVGKVGPQTMKAAGTGENFDEAMKTAAERYTAYKELREQRNHERANTQGNTIG